jgi:hypothetical protein
MAQGQSGSQSQMLSSPAQLAMQGRR